MIREIPDNGVKESALLSGVSRAFLIKHLTRLRKLEYTNLVNENDNQLHKEDEACAPKDK